MTNVWLLGANGMLGSRVSVELTQREIKFVPVTRASFGDRRLGMSQLEDFEAMESLEKLYGTPTHVVNAIGVVKPRIDETNTKSVLHAIQGNAVFPRNLGTYCESNAVHLIQIATDCVYSGEKGDYLETDLHDPTDVYGKTKSLGEFSSDCMTLVRCSIIGRENENKYSLVEWVNSQSLDASINGFMNHNWNGVTTKVFGMIVTGIIQNNLDPVGKFHLIPKDKVSKYELVQLIKSELGRNDIMVNQFKAGVVIDRTLSTVLADLNNKIWASAGFASRPTISEMVRLGL
jgi:dTDP-4-dehydrorhamnose reductase